MKNTLKQILDREGVLVLDGSMGTALENLGADLNNKLWTARVLADRPELVKEVHIQYFRAGADAGITCSYQASLPGLMETGYSREQAEALITRAVQVFQEARQEWWDAEGKQAGRSWPLCLASAGPYGAYLADGSEYKGHYGVSADMLRDFHRRRAELLWQAGADVLLFETEPSLMEAEVEARIAEELGAHPIGSAFPAATAATTVKASSWPIVPAIWLVTIRTCSPSASTARSRNTSPASSAN